MQVPEQFSDFGAKEACTFQSLVSLVEVLDKFSEQHTSSETRQGVSSSSLISRES